MRNLKQIPWQRIAGKITKAYFAALFLVLTGQAIFVVYFADPYDKIEYVAVESNKTDYVVREEGLFFRSFADVKEMGNFAWSDVLRCDPLNDEYGIGYFSKYASDITNSKPAKWGGEGVWHYNAAIPIQDADCELRSTTFVVYKVFLVFEYKKPLKPILSKGKIKFRKEKQP